MVYGSYILELEFDFLWFFILSLNIFFSEYFMLLHVC